MKKRHLIDVSFRGGVNHIFCVKDMISHYSTHRSVFVDCISILAYLVEFCQVVELKKTREFLCLRRPLYQVKESGRLKLLLPVGFELRLSFEPLSGRKYNFLLYRWYYRAIAVVYRIEP